MVKNSKLFKRLLLFWFYFLKDFIYLSFFIERERKGEREEEKHWCGREKSVRCLAHNPGICTDWESNWWPFGSQAGIQSTEPHQPGLLLWF